MTFDQETWKSKLRERLRGWRDRFKSAGGSSLYAFLSAMALWPVVEAARQGDWAALAALGSVAAGVGGNLLANRIQAWKDEADAIRDLALYTPQDPDLRAALDTILEKLDVLTGAGQTLPEAEREWFVQVLREELARQGSAPRFEATLRGVFVIGEHVSVTVQGREPVPAPAALRRAYLMGVIRQCGTLPTLGLKTEAGDATTAEEGAMGLESVYVHLDTIHTVRVRGAGRLIELGETDGLPPLDMLEGRGRVRRQKGEEEREEHREPLTALFAVSGLPSLVLQGGPGSGKSTFANYLALCLATRLLPEQDRPFTLDMTRHLPGWPEALSPLPVWVVLREFARELPADAQKGTADLLWRYIEDRLAPCQEFAADLKQILLDGDALVILDGLDEVPERAPGRPVSPRRLVLEAVQDFSQRMFSQAHYLVTCRASSYVRPWTLAGFTPVTLAEFSQERRDCFCERWYAELARRRELDPEQVVSKVASLQQAIRRPDLARMAGNPLLLTVMALVHARETELPEARALLYDKCVDVLLWLWERRKGEAGRPADLQALLGEAGVDRTFLMRALDRLAFEIHEAGGAQEGAADIRTSALERRLERLYPAADADAEAREKAQVWARRVSTFIRERAGLLVEKQADEVDPVLAFPHRSFQEYLAACWLAQEEDTARRAAKLAQQADHWWEVVKLAAGRLLYVERKITQPLAMVEWLCPEEEPAALEEWRLVQLAGEVLLELKPQQMLRDPELRPLAERRLKAVRDRLVAAMQQDRVLEPRQRAAAGRALALLGDPRFRADAFFLPAEPLLGFVPVSAGPFRMGSRKEDDPDAWEDELPQFEYDISYDYYVARYPVTNAQFQAFAQAGGYSQPGYWTGEGWVWRSKEERQGPHDFGEPYNLPNHPVVGVTWYEALAYSRWLTDVLRERPGTPEPLATLLRVGDEGGSVGAHGRAPALSVVEGPLPWEVALPSEAEWEKAARGGLQIPHAAGGPGLVDNPAPGRRYPWGNDPDPNRANYDDTGIGSTSAVGCFPGGQSPYGALDMSGNAWEWCLTKWVEDYQDYAGREDNDPAGDARRVLRGGAFPSDPWRVRCASRYGHTPLGWAGDPGFRVVLVPR